MSGLEFSKQVDNFVRSLKPADHQTIVEKTLGSLEQTLTTAFYLWYGWIHTDGSWTPWTHWGGATDFRKIVVWNVFNEIEASDNPEERIDEYFRKGRQHFSNEEYLKLYPMFRLFFVLRKINIFNKRALIALESISQEIPQTFPKSLWNADHIGYAGKYSYAEK